MRRTRNLIMRGHNKLEPEPEDESQSPSGNGGWKGKEKQNEREQMISLLIPSLVAFLLVSLSTCLNRGSSRS